MLPSFEHTRQEHASASGIADRAILMGLFSDDQHQSIVMDLIATNANGCLLDLEALRNAPEFDFVHDVTGIYAHLDRTTGQLKDCFVPRYALKSGHPVIKGKGFNPRGGGFTALTINGIEYTASEVAAAVGACAELVDAINICLSAELERQKVLRPGAPASTYTKARIERIRKALELASSIVKGSMNV